MSWALLILFKSVTERGDAGGSEGRVGNGREGQARERETQRERDAERERSSESERARTHKRVAVLGEHVVLRVRVHFVRV